MARGLVWSPEAIEDIEAIASYIERDSAWYERVAASKIVKTAEAIPPYS
jgi:plasmid stabilization system protein ParE